MWVAREGSRRGGRVFEAPSFAGDERSGSGRAEPFFWRDAEGDFKGDAEPSAREKRENFFLKCFFEYVYESGLEFS